ncbi:hypothetical protein [Aureibacter tunicatorum]|uniref:Uncharacterized protein n=1 Tax=Aureibacter tunicatorum TaxID=866807 RepID=A0AAE3XMA6_9BACT|nr:hypothetical protein [Aureibacter tunicatorum]MDR6238559.1 hypothetical protein [Aureibacter tunicatorum]BDD05510.1 hypothetical protein AUTU_29930 [Aureibacter tunicatorum]
MKRIFLIPILFLFFAAGCDDSSKILKQNEIEPSQILLEGSNEIIPSQENTTKLWFEHGNRGLPNALSYDFHDMFTTEKSRLVNALRGMDYFMLRLNLYDSIRHEFFRDSIAPMLIAHNVPLVIDVGSAVWLECRCEQQRVNILNRDISLIRRIKNTGVDVKYVALQSILSKPVPPQLEESCETGETCDYTLGERVADALRYAYKVDYEFDGEIGIGILDALVVKGSHGENQLGFNYRTAYTALDRAFKLKDIKLAFIVFDHPEEYLYSLSSWDRLLEAQRYVSDTIKTDVGILFTSSESKDHDSFRSTVLAFMDEFINRGGKMDHAVLAYWYKEIDNDIPQLRTIIEMAERLYGDSFYEKCTDESYLEQRPDVAQDSYYGTKPDQHFVDHGRFEGMSKPSLD